MRSEYQLEALRLAKPVIRATLAYLAYLRFGPIVPNEETVPHYSAVADRFIDQLEKDLENG